MLNYAIFVATTICYYAILVMSLNIAIGYTGIINLAHVAFFAVGAYTSAILTSMGIAFPIAFVFAILTSALCGVAVTYVTKKLDGDYVALATLGLSFVSYSVILNWDSLTKGARGIPGIDKPSIFSFTFQSGVLYLAFSCVVLVLVTIVLHRMTRSRYGIALQAVRDDAIGAAALGKNIYRLRIQAMAISAGCAGIAGVLFAHFITYIHPSNFFLSDIILMLSIVIVGGLATLRGSLSATILLIVLVEALRFLPFPSDILGPARLMVYAALLIAILVYRPRGLFGKVDL
jgi:branched-chain amino acid transport system permease protein